MKEFKWPLRVYIEDTDAGGIVYYVNYLKFMERARTELLRQIGFDHAEMIALGNMIVVHSAQINYRLPARLDDELIATVSIEDMRRAGLTFAQRIVRADTDELLAEADIRVACVTKETMKPCRMPYELSCALQSYR